MRSRICDVSSLSSLHCLFLDFIRYGDWCIPDILNTISICVSDIKFTYVYDNNSPDYLFEFQSFPMLSEMIKELNVNVDLQFIFRVDLEKMSVTSYAIHLDNSCILKYNTTRNISICLNNIWKDSKYSSSLSSIPVYDGFRKINLLLCNDLSHLCNNYLTDSFGNIYTSQENVHTYVGLIDYTNIENDKLKGRIVCRLTGDDGLNVLELDFSQNSLYCASLSGTKYALDISFCVFGLDHINSINSCRELQTTCEMLIELDTHCHTLLHTYQKECNNFEIAHRKFLKEYRKPGRVPLNVSIDPNIPFCNI